MDAAILNVGLELAMAFGEHWLSPIQSRLGERFAELSPDQLDGYDAACREAMRVGHEQARLALREHPDSQERAYELFRTKVRARFVWIDDANLSHLFSQGCYYAWKDGELR